MSAVADTHTEHDLTGVRRRIDFEREVLVGGACRACGARCWPRGCRVCHGFAVVESELPQHGVLTTWTRVWISVEGLSTPYVTGMVRLGELELHAQVKAPDDALQIGAAVRLGVDESAQPPYWFTTE